MTRHKLETSFGKSLLLKKQRGLSLIESLVSLALVAFGLLAYAGVHLQGIRSANESYLRSQASLLAMELADSVRANRVAWYGTATDYDNPTATNTAACATTAGCTPAQMADHDFFIWSTRVAAVLPNGVGTIALQASKEYLITVTWTELNASASTSFSTRFLP